MPNPSGAGPPRIIQEREPSRGRTDLGPTTVTTATLQRSARPHLIDRSGYVAVLGVAVVLAVISIFVAVAVGAVGFSLAEVWSVFSFHVLGQGSAPDAVLSQIVWDLRFPRALLTLVVGAGLGVAGCVLQALMRNPLADPYITGSVEGATTGAGLVIVLGSGAVGGLGLSASAFAGAMHLRRRTRPGPSCPIPAVLTPSTLHNRSRWVCTRIR